MKWCWLYLLFNCVLHVVLTTRKKDFNVTRIGFIFEFLAGGHWALAGGGGGGTPPKCPPVATGLLHWLPIRFRIIYKLCVLMHLVRVGRSPAYLSDRMRFVADLPGRERLRSSTSFRYELPRLKLKFGERSFSFSGPKVWNSLPANLQELTNTDTFKKLLKTHRFKLAFGELEWLCGCTIGHCRCNWRISLHSIK